MQPGTARTYWHLPAARKDHTFWGGFRGFRAGTMARRATRAASRPDRPQSLGRVADPAEDLLLVRPDGLSQDDEDAWEEQVAEMRRAVIRWTGNNCQTFQVDRTRLLEHVTARDPLVDAWFRDGVELAGMPLTDLIGRVRRLPVP